MKKRLISTFLVAALAVTMVIGVTDSAEARQRNKNSSDDVEEYSTEIDMDEEPYTVAIQVVELPGVDYTDTLEAREEAINAITVPAINCQVEIQDTWISELANNTSMGIAGSDKIDLVAVGTVQPLSSMVGSEMLIDLNEGDLLQNRGADIAALQEDILSTGYVSGKQLAIPAQTFNAYGRGIYYNKTLADAAGVELGEYITMDELEEALEQIHEYDSSVYCYYAGEGTSNYMYWLYQYDTFGNESSYGIVWDAEEDPTVVNLYATDEYREFCERMQRWNEMGLQPGDPTDTTTAQDYFSAQKLFCVVATVAPSQDAVWASDDFETASAMLVEPSITNSSVTEYMWGIAATCERPDKAMDFLNFLYTNADVANILMYGLEGVTYDFYEGSDTVIDTYGNYSPNFYRGGDTAEMYIEYPNPADLIEESEALEEESYISPLVGYMFDDTDFQTESAVLDSTIAQYEGQLQNGMAGSQEATDALIDEFVEALERAGISDVIAANQEQIDAYLAEQ